MGFIGCRQRPKGPAQTAVIDQETYRQGENQAAQHIQAGVLLDEQSGQADQYRQNCYGPAESAVGTQAAAVPDRPGGANGANHMDGGEHVGVGVDGVQPRHPAGEEVIPGHH